MTQYPHISRKLSFKKRCNKLCGDGECQYTCLHSAFTDICLSNPNMPTIGRNVYRWYRRGLNAMESAVNEAIRENANFSWCLSSWAWDCHVCGLPATSLGAITCNPAENKPLITRGVAVCCDCYNLLNEFMALPDQYRHFKGINVRDFEGEDRKVFMLAQILRRDINGREKNRKNKRTRKEEQRRPARCVV